MNKNPRLILAGAGPGDPELLTIKAFKAIKDAEIILYDALVNPKIFDLVFGADFDINSDKFIYVGKRKGLSQGKQEEINDLILKFLQDGKFVLRLKGGDPLIFSRGIEEYNIALTNGYPCEIIPGLSSGLAAASLNQVTLTHRAKADSLLLETGHDFNQDKGLYWSQALEHGATLIVYMALGKIAEICDFVKTQNLSDIKIIAIENASLFDQRIIKSDLENLTQDLIDQSFKSPVIFYFGKYIDLALPQAARHNLASERVLRH